jgi:hypothetical protein
LATIDLQVDLACAKLHPVSVQSVPIGELGRSQKFSVTLQLAGVMTASVAVPSDSSPVVSSGDGDGDSEPPGLATSPLAFLLGSGVGSNAHAYTLMSIAIARQLIRLNFPMTTSCVSAPDHPGWASPARAQEYVRVAGSARACSEPP